MVKIESLDTRANAEAGVKFVPKHPKTGVPLDCYLILRGQDSRTYKASLMERRRARLARSAKLQASGQPQEIDLDNLEAEALESLVSMTLGFGGWSKGDDAELPYSAANARLLYESLDWLREQAQIFIGDRANFLPDSATS